VLTCVRLGLPWIPFEFHRRSLRKWFTCTHNAALQGRPLAGVPCKRLLGTKHGLIRACPTHGLRRR
jgi:hypothetical protein